MVLHQSARVRRRPIDAVQIPPQHAQHCHLLPPMVGRVRNPPRHHPCARPRHIKKSRLPLPPPFLLAPQRRQPLPAVFRVSPHKLEPRLAAGQRRRSHVDSQHVPEPQVLAHALMHHLLSHAPPPRIPRIRPELHVLVSELAPHAPSHRSPPKTRTSSHPPGSAAPPAGAAPTQPRRNPQHAIPPALFR